ncbi:hypothetical protein VTH06DRAFT_8508 [Thermothelomyces fergusii]
MKGVLGPGGQQGVLALKARGYRNESLAVLVRTIRAARNIPLIDSMIVLDTHTGRADNRTIYRNEVGKAEKRKG